MIEALARPRAAKWPSPPCKASRVLRQLRVKGIPRSHRAYNARRGANEDRHRRYRTRKWQGAKGHQGYKAAEDTLQANPGCRGIFAINDPAGPRHRACEAVEAAGKTEQIIIVGFDKPASLRTSKRSGRQATIDSLFSTRMRDGQY